MRAKITTDTNRQYWFYRDPVEIPSDAFVVIVDPEETTVVTHKALVAEGSMGPFAVHRVEVDSGAGTSGILGRIADALANEEISALMVGGYSADLVFVESGDASRAYEALRLAFDPLK